MSSFETKVATWFSVSPLFISPFIDTCTHSQRCLDGVVVARESRGFRGAGSIPAHGSDKTKDEVLAILLTQNSRPGETSSSQDQHGLFMLVLFLDAWS